MARILIIEDDAPSRQLAEYLLSHAGHEVITADNGLLGLLRALTEAPELILCDLQIPQLDGYQLLERLRADRRWRRVPLVALTAFSMIGDRERILEAGFDGYLSKPITPEGFAGEVARFLTPG